MKTSSLFCQSSVALARMTRIYSGLRQFHTVRPSTSQVSLRSDASSTLGSPIDFVSSAPIREFAKKKDVKSKSKAPVEEEVEVIEFDINDADADFGDNLAWLEEKYQSMQIGRADPASIANIQVIAFEMEVPLNSIANISNRSTTVLQVALHDPSLEAEVIKAIGSAIAESNPYGEDSKTGLRQVIVPFPKVTAAQRAEMIKVAKSLLEDCKTHIRHTRKTWMDEIKAAKLPKDFARRAEQELQQKVEKKNADATSMYQKKEKELNSSN